MRAVALGALSGLVTDRGKTDGLDVSSAVAKGPDFEGLARTVTGSKADRLG
jgi:hypothetical protein